MARGQGRDKMVESAIQLFRQHGYKGTGMRDVVAHSGAPWGSLHHYFPGGKAQLGVEALELAGERIESVFTQGAREGADFVAGFEWVWSWWIGYVVGDDFEAGCPIAGVAAESHPDAAELSATAAKVFERWVDSITVGLQISGVAEAEARELGTLIIAAQEGATLMARAERSPEPLEKVGRALAGLLRERLDRATQPAPSR